MGATKRLAEILVVELQGQYPATAFAAVRFGNVLGSNGSVIPIFRRAIQAGKPLMVTHPDITRYFMTIPEAVRLILHAGAIGLTGDIHVLNMGSPIRIVDLARDLIRLSSPAGAKDIGIVFTGLRPGEKLEESLFGEDEESVATESPFLLIARGERSASAATAARELEAMAEAGDDEGLRTRLAGWGTPAAVSERSRTA